MPDPGVVIETDRLLLRLLTNDDLDPLARIYADPEVRRFFPEGTLTRAETREELEWILDVYYARYGTGLWATVLRDTGALIGRCGLLPWAVVPTSAAALGLEHAPEDPADAARIELELAYLLGRDHWGLGLATEAARAIVAHGLAMPGVERLICLVDENNHASRAVATRAGLVVDGDVELEGEVFPLYTVGPGRTAAAPHRQG